MKTACKLVVLLSLGVPLSCVASAAQTPEQAYLATCRKGADVPVPIAVVSPRVSPENIGATVGLEFVVETNGQPTAFNVKSSPDAALSVAVLDAVKQWRFKPVMRNGAPVATKVALPVTVQAAPLTGTRYAVQ